MMFEVLSVARSASIDKSVQLTTLSRDAEMPKIIVNSTLLIIIAEAKHGLGKKPMRKILKYSEEIFGEIQLFPYVV